MLGVNESASRARFERRSRYIRWFRLACAARLAATACLFIDFGRLRWEQLKFTYSPFRSPVWTLVSDYSAPHRRAGCRSVTNNKTIKRQIVRMRDNSPRRLQRHSDIFISATRAICLFEDKASESGSPKWLGEISACNRVRETDKARKTRDVAGAERSNRSEPNDISGNL